MWLLVSVTQRRTLTHLWLQISTKTSICSGGNEPLTPTSTWLAQSGKALCCLRSCSGLSVCLLCRFLNFLNPSSTDQQTPPDVSKSPGFGGNWTWIRTYIRITVFTVPCLVPSMFGLKERLPVFIECNERGEQCLIWWKNQCEWS